MGFKRCDSAVRHIMILVVALTGSVQAEAQFSEYECRANCPPGRQCHCSSSSSSQNNSFQRNMERMEAERLESTRRNQERMEQMRLEREQRARDSAAAMQQIWNQGNQAGQELQDSFNQLGREIQGALEENSRPREAYTTDDDDQDDYYYSGASDYSGSSGVGGSQEASPTVEPSDDFSGFWKSGDKFTEDFPVETKVAAPTSSAQDSLGRSARTETDAIASSLPKFNASPDAERLDEAGRAIDADGFPQLSSGGEASASTAPDRAAARSSLWSRGADLVNQAGVNAAGAAKSAWEDPRTQRVRTIASEGYSTYVDNAAAAIQADGLTDPIQVAKDSATDTALTHATTAFRNEVRDAAAGGSYESADAETRAEIDLQETGYDFISSAIKRAADRGTSMKQSVSDAVDRIFGTASRGVDELTSGEEKKE